jgi:hypothetical protein
MFGFCFRFTPNLVAVILFCTYVVNYLGSGPQWNLVVKRHSDICKKNMWRNFLYIQNYFGFEDMVSCYGTVVKNNEYGKCVFLLFFISHLVFMFLNCTYYSVIIKLITELTVHISLTTRHIESRSK